MKASAVSSGNAESAGLFLCMDADMRILFMHTVVLDVSSLIFSLFQPSLPAMGAVRDLFSLLAYSTHVFSLTSLAHPCGHMLHVTHASHMNHLCIIHASSAMNHAQQIACNITSSTKDTVCTLAAQPEMAATMSGTSMRKGSSTSQRTSGHDKKKKCTSKQTAI
jgi:hypothetical protein